LDQTIGIGKRVIALDSKKFAARQFPKIAELSTDITGGAQGYETSRFIDPLGIVQSRA
jgi:hypothetical protein